MKCIFTLFADNYRNNAIITEFINKLSVKSDIIRAVPGFFHFSLCITLCSKIELVALISKLCNSCYIYRNKIADSCLHIKALEIFAVISERGLLCISHSIFLVHFITLEVVLIKCSNLEKSASVYCSDVVFDRIH